MVLNENADVFSKHKANIGCCHFVEHEIDFEGSVMSYSSNIAISLGMLPIYEASFVLRLPYEEGVIPHREGARRGTPQKLEACLAI